LKLQDKSSILISPNPCKEHVLRFLTTYSQSCGTNFENYKTFATQEVIWMVTRYSLDGAKVLKMYVQ
jgi:hypothetical protein